MIHIHFTGPVDNPTLQLKRPIMPSFSNLRITYGPNDTVTLTGTEAQINRLFTLALDSARSNITLSRPTLYTAQQELDDLRSMHKEWFTS